MSNYVELSNQNEYNNMMSLQQAIHAPLNEHTIGGDIMEYLGKVFSDIPLGGQVEFHSWIAIGGILSCSLLAIYLVYLAIQLLIAFIEDDGLKFRGIEGQIIESEDSEELVKELGWAIVLTTCLWTVLVILLPLIYYNYQLVFIVGLVILGLFGIRALRRTQKILSKHISNAKAHEEGPDLKECSILETNQPLGRHQFQ
ncbi:MAG: hypothetical protein KUG81_11100 [Gammaproteobacteria bacterium]|nr:hypothetical protein [Gammaproteobacteria bacterium]